MATKGRKLQRHIELPLLRAEAVELLRRVAADHEAELQIDPAASRFTIALLQRREDRLVVRGEMGPVAAGTRLVLTLPSPSRVRPSFFSTAALTLSLVASVIVFAVATGAYMLLAPSVLIALAVSFGRNGQRSSKRVPARRLAMLTRALSGAATRALSSAPTPAPEPARPPLAQHIPTDSDRRLLSGPAPGSGGLQLDVRHGYLYPVARFLGVQDERLGDAAFDDRFIVKTNDVGFARAWLSAPLRAELLALVDHVGLRLEDGQMVLEELQPFVAASERLRAVALAGGIADRARAMLAEWRTVATQLDGCVAAIDDRWAADGSATLTFERHGSAVIVDCVAGAPRPGARPQLVTRVRCHRVALEGEAFSLQRCEGTWQVRGGDGQPRLGAALRGQLGACEPEQVIVEASEALVVLLGFVSDAGRLAAAGDLAATLASAGGAVAPRGPYR